MKLLDLNIGIKLDNNNQVIEFIKKENADICTFQEAMNGIDDTCYENFKSKNKIIEIENYKYNAFAPLFVASGITKNNVVVRDFGGKAEQGSLIISKHNIKEHYNQFYYNEYKYSYDATHFKESDWCRSIQNAILEVDGKELQIINVHGIWNKDKIGDDRTIRQSKFILEKIRKDIPVIVVGDFNLLPNTESIYLLNKELVNLIDKYNIKSTRPNFDDGLDKGNMVCDYIFVNDKIKVNDFKVIESNISDHLPLILDFDIKEEEQMNKVVLVTGSSRGIGKATIIEFASKGYNVVINYNNSENEALELKKYVEENYNIKALIIKADVSNEVEVKGMVSTIINEFGSIDVLVNNAGIVYDRSFEEIKVSEFEKTLKVNVIGAFIVAREVAKYMNNGSAIINVSSTSGTKVMSPDCLDYNISKIGLQSLTRDLAYQFKPNIKVNAIAIGWADTDMNKDLPKDYIEEETAKIYVERFANPSEIAKTIYFLASDNSSYINDEIINIDGGY